VWTNRAEKVAESPSETPPVSQRPQLCNILYCDKMKENSAGICAIHNVFFKPPNQLSESNAEY
jgi:hypothetical protein